MVKFECMRCGHCCNNLADENSDNGLYMNEEEAKLFPADWIDPLFKDENGKIFAYQLNKYQCPYLKIENGLASCSIHDKRPLSCRAFPLSGINDIHTGLCKYINKHQNEEWDMNSFKDERIAVQQEIEELKTTPKPYTMFLLNLKKWILHD